MPRFAIVLLLSASLGACTVQGPASIVSVTKDTPTLSAFASAPKPPTSSDRHALVHMPAAAGGIERVGVDRFANGYRQSIALGSSVPGLPSNQIDVRLRAVTNVAAIEPLAIEPPTESMIRGELASLFPKMEMRIGDQPRSNAAGVYGFASGRWENGTRCIYAWQWVDNPKRTETSTYDAAAIRVRLCGRRVTLDHLAGLIDELQISTTSVEPEVVASAPPSERVKPHSRRTRYSGARSQLTAAPISRYSAWDEAALRRRLPIVPTSQQPTVPIGSVLDSGLPAAAFRGPSAETRTANR